MASAGPKREAEGVIAVAKPNVRLKLVALPTEHGGWGMLGAPVLLGLLVAPSVSGAWLALFGIGSFLTRQPLRLSLADLRRGKTYPRTGWAVFFAALYGFVALAGLLLAWQSAQGPFWIPLAAMALMGAFQFSNDLDGKGRAFIPEAIGASALALIGASIVLAGGRSWIVAAIVAVVIVAQEVPSILYASARLRKARGQEVRQLPVRIAHLLALLVVFSLVVANLLGWPVVIAFLILPLRATWGLSFGRKVPTALVGVQELGYSLLTVILAWLSLR